DPAAPLPVALGEQPERGLDALDVVLGRGGQVLDGQRLRRDDEQRLDRAGELVDRVRRDQAERTVHPRLLSSAALATRIGANGAACSIATSPALRSSSMARNATACSTRVSCATSWSKSKRRLRESRPRKRSRNCETGGKRSAMWLTEGAGGS